MIRFLPPPNAYQRRRWLSAALLLLGCAVAPHQGLAQIPMATIAWSHDLKGPEYSGSMPIWVSPTGKAIAIDVREGTMRFMATLDSPPVERKARGKILAEIGDTIVVGNTDRSLLFYTIDGTLRRILPVIPATLRIPGSGHVVAVTPPPIVLSVGAGDTLALQGSLPPGRGIGGNVTQGGIDHMIWWQHASGEPIGSPLAVPRTDCVRDIPGEENEVTQIVPPFCAGAGLLSAVLPHRRVALIDAPQGAGADGSFRLLILSSAGDTLLAQPFALAPRPITDSMWQAALRTPLFASGRLQIPATARPAIKFPVADVRAAPRDGVWIRPAFDDGSAVWWRVDEHGTLRSIVRLPQPLNVVALTDSELITVSPVKGGKQITAWRAPQ